MGQNFDTNIVNISTAADMRAAVEARKHEEAMSRDKKPGSASDDGSGGEIDSDFIRQCLYKNEFGDGELFKRQNRGLTIYNNAMGLWMSWDGHHWKVDEMEKTLGRVEDTARVYEEEARLRSKEVFELEAEGKPTGALKEEQKLLTKRTWQLRSSRRRKNCLEFARTTEDGLAIQGSEIDAMPWLLPCANGVINLKTGELEDGRQEDLLLKSSPVTWKGIDEPCKIWERTLLEILSGNERLVHFFQKICGYSLVGEVMQSIMVVMTGRGRNGKSMIIETLSEVLGPLAGPIQAEMLLKQFKVSSSGPSPEIMSLRGLRMAFASETDDGCKISPSRVKWLTGNDTIIARSPHDKYEVPFKPSHTLFLLTNHKPHAPADDFAFWERMVLVPFNLSFVDREPRTDVERRADPLLAKKLIKEYPGILAWMVRGCLLWQAEGLQPPAAVKEAVSEYRRSEDSIGDFIDECCVVGAEFSVGATALYEVFYTWWETNVSTNVPKQKRFGTLFSKRFEKRKEGTMKYFGVGLLTGDMDLPFLDDPDKGR